MFAGLTATEAAAQEGATTPCTSHVTDWSVCVAQEPKECWAVTTYKESVNTKEGRVVAVRRGDILFMVFFRPDAGVKGQIGFTGGYPFAPNSTVSMDIDGTKFELFTEGEWAWPASASDDAKIVAALKRGSSAVMTARSARGTKTEDTFSLLGFTAAYDEAEKRCS
nr:invasion associated locus B family protein [Shimia biformata]